MKVNLVPDCIAMKAELERDEARPLGRYDDHSAPGNYHIMHVGPKGFYGHKATVYIGAAENINNRVDEHLSNFDHSNLQREHFLLKAVIPNNHLIVRSFEQWWFDNIGRPIWNELTGFGNSPSMGRFKTKKLHTYLDYYHLRHQLAMLPAPCSPAALARKLEAVAQYYYNLGQPVSWDVQEMVKKAYRSPAGYFHSSRTGVRPY